jgi:hypothetical protein
VYDREMFADKLFGDSFMYHVPHNVNDEMIKHDLIRQSKEVRMLTGFGKEIYEQGGWRAYLNRKRQKEILEKERIRMQDEKLKYDLRVSKFLARAKAWPLIISFISLLVSIYSLFKEQINGWFISIFN